LKDHGWSVARATPWRETLVIYGGVRDLLRVCRDIFPDIYSNRIATGTSSGESCPTWSFRNGRSVSFPSSRPPATGWREDCETTGSGTKEHDDRLFCARYACRPGEAVSEGEFFCAVSRTLDFQGWRQAARWKVCQWVGELHVRASHGNGLSHRTRKRARWKRTSLSFFWWCSRLCSSRSMDATMRHLWDSRELRFIRSLHSAAKSRLPRRCSVDAAKVALAEAERSASEAASSVMSEEAERVATYLDAARREVWRLEAQLHGLSELWLPTGKGQAPRPVRLTPQVLGALSAQEPQYPPSMRPEIKQAAAWRSFHAALLADPAVRWDDDAA
jgi:hypothetical protein